MSIEHMKYLEVSAKNIMEVLKIKESIYDGSWKKRGGVGAFFVTSRKWDALEHILQKLYGYDILKGALEQGDGDGTIRDQIRDLIGYLLLIESEITRLRTEGNQSGEKAYGGAVTGRLPNTPSGLAKPVGDVLQTGKPRRIPHTAEYRGESIHKQGLHTGTVYLCFNIMDDGSMVYIRNAYNEMIWCDATLFSLTYNDEGED